MRRTCAATSYTFRAIGCRAGADDGQGARAGGGFAERLLTHLDWLGGCMMRIIKAAKGREPSRAQVARRVEAEEQAEALVRRAGHEAMSKVARRLRACWTKSKSLSGSVEQTDRRIQGAAGPSSRTCARRGR